MSNNYASSPFLANLELENTSCCMDYQADDRCKSSIEVTSDFSVQQTVTSLSVNDKPSLNTETQSKLKHI